VTACAGLLAALLLAPEPASGSPLYWSDDQRLTETGAESLRPAIAAAPDGQLHVVWDDYRNLDHEIYYKNRTGSTWTIDDPITGG